MPRKRFSASRSWVIARTAALGRTGTRRARNWRALTGTFSNSKVTTETPAAIFQLGSYTSVTDRLVGLTWGAEDLSAAIGARATRDDARRTLGRMIEVLVRAEATPTPSWEAPPQAEVEVEASAAAAGVARVLRTLEVLGHVKRRDDLAYSPEEEREVIKRLKAFGYM